MWVGLLAREIFVRELGLGKKKKLNRRKKLCGIPSSLSTFVEPFLLCKVPCFHPVCLSFIYESFSIKRHISLSPFSDFVNRVY